MPRRLSALVVLSLAVVAGVLLVRPAAVERRIQPIARRIGMAPASGDRLERHRQVALQFAPIFVQKRSKGRENDAASGAAFEDYFTTLAYDGEWNGYTNHGHLQDAAVQGRDLRGFVYYAVQETEDNYYLHYAYFHPDDPKWLGPHENDMEGALLVVRKTAGGAADPATLDAAHLVVVQAQAHNRFAYRKLPEVCRGSGRGLDDVVCGSSASPEKTHVVLVSQEGSGWPWSQGHGTEIPRQRGHYDGPSIVYVPGEQAEVPACPPCDQPARYGLLSLTGDRDGDGIAESDVDGTGAPSSRGPWDRRGDPRVFARSQTYVVGGKTFTWGHALHGHQGCKANLPWGWYGKGENLPPGAFFLDPAGQQTTGPREILARYGVNEPATPRYLSNVFLANVILPETTPSSAALFDCRCEVIEQGAPGLDALALGPRCVDIPRDRALPPVETSAGLGSARPIWNTCDELAEWIPVGVEQGIESVGAPSSGSCFVRLAPGAFLTIPRRYPIERPQDLPALVDPRRFPALLVRARAAGGSAQLGGFYLQVGREYDDSMSTAPFFAPAPLASEWREVRLAFDRSARFVPATDISLIAVGPYIGPAFAGSEDGAVEGTPGLEIDRIELAGPDLVSRGGEGVGRPAPRVTGLTPGEVRFGEPVTLAGSGFAPECERNEVRFGALPLPVIRCSESELVVAANGAGEEILEVRSGGLATARSPSPLRILGSAR